MTPIRTLAFATLLASALAAQTPPATPAPQAKPAEPDLATLRAMKSKLFVVQYRDALQLQRALSALGSGANGATMRFTNEGGLNTIGVRDFPENLALIEEALKRLDVPAQAQKTPDVVLTLHVLFASRQPAAESPVPSELNDVLKSLHATLAFRGYTLAATLSQRVGVNGDRTIQGRGQIDGGLLGFGSPKEPSTLKLQWESDRGVAMEPGANGAATYALRKFQFWLRDRDDRNLATLETGISLKEGEKVVVGSSMVKDRGVIVVLTLRQAD